jgi:diguanylate cyclase (GGDEF)-like protein/PAS domain S-box-containing protein
MPASLDGSERVLLDQLFESAPEAIVLADQNSRVIRTNAEFTRLFGYASEEARGRSLDELLAPLELLEEAERATATVASGGHVSFETVRRHKDGTRVHVSVLGTPIRVRHDLVAVFGIYRDVTPLKRTIDALRATEAQFAVTFRATPGPAIITTVEGARILEVNDAFEAVTGYSHSEVVGQKVHDIQLWVDTREWERMLGLVMREGRIRNFEYQFRTRKGEIRTGLFSAESIEFRNERCILSVTHDITERTRVERALRESEERYRTILETIEDGYYELDTAGRLTAFNSAFELLLGFDPGKLRGLTFREFTDPEHAQRVAAVLNDVYASGTPQRIPDWEVIRSDGQRRSVEASVAPVRDAAGWVTGYRGIVRDVTDRKRTEQALRESEARYALAARGANDGLWDWDINRGTIYYSPRWKEMLGYAPDEVGTTPDEWVQRIHPDDAPRVRGELQSHLAGPSPHFESEHRVLHRDGTYRWVVCRAAAVRDEQGRATRLAGSITDLTGRKTAEERLVHDALHDVLTGLPNRALFASLLQRSMARSRRHPEHQFAVLFLDLDRFKLINDSLGHMVGDEFLAEVSRRLVGCLRPEDTVARLGGDEFTVMVEDVEGPSDAVRVAERIQSELTNVIQISGHETYTSASIGIALSDSRYETPEEMLRDADIAMYRAKSRGRARQEVFDVNMHQEVLELLRVETDLRHALERDEFRLAFQPIINTATGRIVGLEALLRWRHPERGMVLPAAFIHLAEETGLIAGIGEWVLWKACRQAQVWQALLPPEIEALPVSVNLSARQFGDPRLIDIVATTLAVTGLSPRALRLELTESVLMDHAESSVHLLDRLKALGVQIQVDDFGTGYSSLGYLHKFPIDALKIDASFVGRLEADSENREIVRTIVALAKNLRMAVVAEGVETTAQMAFLRELGCEVMQGFLFAGPLDPNDVERLLAQGPEWPQPAVAEVERARRYCPPQGGIV